ncbi:beta strand repeat-containing protein, partial [Megasphaera sp.]|uniref:beta strand repeat-containing protein n=1 Tax=Megasphaera sp. TaxID=2023260 RepID=UPI00359F6834
MAQWTNTMLATTGDVQASGSTRYGTDGKARTATKLLNESLNITGGGTSLTESALTSDPNIGTVISDNQVAIRLAKNLTGLQTASFTNPTTGNSTVVSGDGITITPSTGDPVSLTNGGLDNGNNRITNVATGVKDTDAVNVKQLKDEIGGITGGSGKTTNLTVDGGTAAPTDGTYAGSNLQVTATEGTASTTYDLKLADNVTLGSTGTSGTDGSLTVNGKDGESVAINGSDGSIALTGADGSTATIAAGPAANDVNGNSVNRITAGGQTVATLNDGMVYTGDTGSAAVKLNKTVNIVGGETDASKLSTDNNIGIVASQDDDNGKLTVRLAKDITGLNTVEAGDAVIGNQGVTTAGNVAQDGSYVTGLDNTSWNVTNPDIVTGRAATEDQLKTVSDAITDGTSENATGGFGLADDSGATVKQNLGKTIAIKGGVTEGTVTTENPNGTSNITTAVKDGALEVSLNKDLDLGSTGSVTTGNTVVNNDGVKVGDAALTSSGLTITDGPSVTTDGIDGGSKQITNVASGSDGTDAEGNKTYNTDTNAANIGDIKNITNTTVNNAKTELTNKGLDFTVDSGDSVHRNLGETLNIAGDGNITTTSDAANGKITVGLSNTVSVGTTGTDGKNGTVTVNGTDGSAVAINGADGSISLKTGSGSPITIQAGSSVNDVTGSPVNRITVGGQTVATMNDGMKYGGDFGTASNVKLNNQVDVKGEATTEADLTTGNIGVVSSQAGNNGRLTVKLNKDINLGATGSVSVGKAVLGNQTVTTAGGVSQTGTYLTGLENVTWDTANPDAVNGRAATEDQLKALNDKVNSISTGAGGFGLTDDSDTAVKQDLGETIQIAGDGNITTAADADGKKLTVALSDTIALGEKASDDGTTEGTDGSITVNGKDGSAVAINGADGSISLNTGSGSPITIQAGSSVNDVTGSPVNRITVGGETVATMSDGQKYAGDNGQTDTTQVIAKKLNEQLDIVGGADIDKLTDKNIGVNNVNGQLKVQLAQNLDLGDNGSVTTGNTVINNDGVTITPDTGNPVSLTGTGLDNGGNTITNVGDGTKDTDAVNYGQLKAAATAVTVEGGTAAGTDGNYTGSNLKLTATTVGDKTTYDLKLSDNITLGSKNGADGTEGVDSSITMNGAEGSSVVIDGGDGSISLTGTDGSSAAIAAGPAANDVNGNSVNRITVGGQTVATMSDGQKYAGDNGQTDTTQVIAKKLNEQLDIVGGADATKLTDNNIGVNNV